MHPTTTAHPGASDEASGALVLPAARCLTKDQAAQYLGIGVTLLKVWACLASSSGVGVCTMSLTWTHGLRNISSEGGPERKLYGP